MKKALDAVPTMTTAEVAAWREEMARYAGVPTVADLILAALSESEQAMSLRQLQIVTGMYETPLLGLLVILEQQGRIQREEVLSKHGVATATLRTVIKRFWKIATAIVDSPWRSETT